MKKLSMLFIALLLCAPLCAFAADASAEGSKPPPGTSPTDVINRSDIDLKYVDTQGKATSLAMVGRLDYALRSDVLLRFDLPLVNVDPNVNGVDSETGFGDLFLRLGWRFHDKDGFSAFFGADFILDTASEDILGGGTHIFAPLLAGIAMFPAQKAIGGVILSQYIDIGGDRRQDINETEVRPVAVFSLDDGMWIVVDTHFYVDWKNDHELGWLQEVQFGKMLSPKLGITVTPGIGIFGDNRQVSDWQIKAGVRYFF